MRPRQVLTLKDLKDLITQFEATFSPSTSAADVHVYWQGEHGHLEYPSLIAHDYDGPGTHPFLVIDYWTDEELAMNAAHNDTLGTPEHFVS
jgi:hypothetical protein